MYYLYCVSHVKSLVDLHNFSSGGGGGGVNKYLHPCMRPSADLIMTPGHS